MERLIIQTSEKLQVCVYVPGSGGVDLRCERVSSMLESEKCINLAKVAQSEFCFSLWEGVLQWRFSSPNAVPKFDLWHGINNEQQSTRAESL